MNSQNYYFHEMSNRADGYSDHRNDRLNRNSMAQPAQRGNPRDFMGQNIMQSSNPQRNLPANHPIQRQHYNPTMNRPEPNFSTPKYEEYSNYQDNRQDQYYSPQSSQMTGNFPNNNFGYIQQRTGGYTPQFNAHQRVPYGPPNNNMMQHSPPGYHPSGIPNMRNMPPPPPQNLPVNSMYSDIQRTSTSLPIGSNAQGRAVNKMLLDLLRERIVDPQRLNLAIETFVDRMDCVNLATLLFHTGKKRMPLLPYYVKLIADRFQVLAQEELRAREASNALYGLKCFTADIPEVRELVFALANKIQSSKSSFVAQAVGNALYGLQNLSSEHEEVRYLLLTLSNKVNECHELLEAQNIGNALYGLRNMNSDYREVRVLVSALTPKIANAREELNGQAMGNSLYGLQSMSSKEAEVRSLLTVLAAKVNRAWEELKAQEVGNALYGLKRMHSEYAEVRLLIAALVPKVSSSPELLDAQAIGNSFYGLQNMKSDNQEVLSLLKILAQKVMISSPELDGQAMGNALYGLQGMNSDFVEVQEVIQALTQKIQQSTLDMNAQELGNALYGMQNMSSSVWVVRQLLVSLAQKIKTSKQELGSQEIGNALFGVQRMSTHCMETRILLQNLTQKIYQSHQILDPQGISNSLYGLQTSSNECYDIQRLIEILSVKIEPCWKILSPHHIAYACYGLQNCTNHRISFAINNSNQPPGNNGSWSDSPSNMVVLNTSASEVQHCLAILVNKIIICREEMTFKQIAFAVYGLQSMATDDSVISAVSTSIDTSVPSFSHHILGMVTALTEKLSLSNSIGQVLYTMTLPLSSNTPTSSTAGSTPLHHIPSSHSHSGITSLGSHSHSTSNHAIQIPGMSPPSSSANNHIWQYGYYLSLLIFGLQGICSKHQEIGLLFQLINQKILHPLYSANLSSSGINSTANCSNNGSIGMSLSSNVVIPPLIVVPNSSALPLQSVGGGTNLQPLGLEIALFSAQDIGNIIFGLQSMSTAHSPEISQFLTYLMTPIQQIETKRHLQSPYGNVSPLSVSNTPHSGRSTHNGSVGVNSPWTMPVCKNIVFGLQQCSVHHQTVQYLLHLMLHSMNEHLQALQGTSSVSGNVSINSITSSIPSTMSNMDQHNIADIYQEVIELYQILVTIIPQLPDLVDYPLLSKDYAVLMSEMEVFLLDNEHYLNHSNKEFTTLEQQVYQEFSSVLHASATANNLMKYQLQRGAFVGGFEVPLLLSISSSSSLNEENIAIEVEGTSYSFPAKRRFFQLRNQYLEKSKDVCVVTIPKDFLLASGSVIQSLRLYSDYLTSTVSSMGSIEKRRFGAVQILLDIFCNIHPSLSLNVPNNMDYIDDEISLVTSKVNNTNKQIIRRPYGITIGWLGKRPTFSSSTLTPSSNISGNTAASPASSVATPHSTQSSTPSNHLISRKTMSSAGPLTSSATSPPLNYAFDGNNNYPVPGNNISNGVIGRGIPTNTQSMTPTRSTANANPQNNTVSRLAGYMTNVPSNASSYPAMAINGLESSQAESVSYDDIFSNPAALSALEVTTSRSYSGNIYLPNISSDSNSNQNSSTSNTTSQRYSNNGNSTVDDLVDGFEDVTTNQIPEENHGVDEINHDLNFHASDKLDGIAVASLPTPSTAKLHEGSEVDASQELALLEKQLEIAKLEAKIQSLKLQKQQK